MKKYLIILIIIFEMLSSGLYSQSLEIIDIDTNSQSPKKNLPFDTPFILKIKQDSKPNFIVLAEHKRNKTLAKSINSTCYNLEKKLIEIPETNFWMKGNYLYIKFDNLKYYEF
jgi:hypothetical protein